MGGGGGGSFVYRSADAAGLLVAAGGGGGAGIKGGGLPANSSTGAFKGEGFFGDAGTGGNGGGAATTAYCGGSGGGGLLTDGGSFSDPGYCFVSGGGALANGAAGSSGGLAAGGYGGGGGGSGLLPPGGLFIFNGGGGGGGYNGGGGGGNSENISSAGGGGGSYDAGTRSLSEVGVQAGNGTVTISPAPTSGGGGTFTYTGALQTYTVPDGVASITIDASGAQGGNGLGGAGGKGAHLVATVPVTPGQTLHVLVGGAGATGSHTGGGGGGSFVYSTPTVSGLLMAAAGGGGGSVGDGGLGGNASVGGGDGDGALNSMGISIGVGGTGGNGGMPGLLSGCASSAGGGLLTKGGDGATDGTTCPSRGGEALASGGAGGAGNDLGGAGGYGGGGAGGYLSGSQGGGGGGGYNGGGGANAGEVSPFNHAAGGGGGSISKSPPSVSESGAQTGNGSVTITPVPTPDGSGSLTYSDDALAPGSTGNTLHFTFTLPSGYAFTDGVVQITLPAGWTTPSTFGPEAGYTTSTCGTVAAADDTITVNFVDLVATSCTITYGDKSHGGVGVTAPATTGPNTFTTETKTVPGGTLTPIASSPVVRLGSGDGAGTMTASLGAAANGSSGNTIYFTYTAPAGGVVNGTVVVTVPPGWDAPCDASAGCAQSFDISSGFSSICCIWMTGRQINVAGVNLDAGQSFTIVYGAPYLGTATAPTTPGKQTWVTMEQSAGTPGSTLTRLAASPVIRVMSPDGSGKLTARTASVSASSHATVVLAYSPGPGGIENGAVTVQVPDGWSAPSTSPTDAGYVTATAGTVSTSGQTITVSDLTLAGTAMVLKYGSRAGGGPGASVPAATGPQTWAASARSSANGTITPLVSGSPEVTVFAPDGSGTLTTPTSTVGRSSTGNTISFTYTAAAGDVSNGGVLLQVPGKWSPPSTTPSDPGYTTADAGTVAVSGQTVTVKGLTLAAGGTVTITYGAGTGATAPDVARVQTWTAKERSTNAGALALLATQPVIAVS